MFIFIPLSLSSSSLIRVSSSLIAKLLTSHELLKSKFKRIKTVLFPCNNSTQLSGLSCYSSSCLLIHDVEKLDKGFHPKQLNCTHYSRVYRNGENFEVGSRVSFDIPDHVPNPCNECKKPDGNCGAGLRCVCHPKKCKDKVISVGGVVKPCGDMLVCLVFFLFMMGFLHGF